MLHHFPVIADYWLNFWLSKGE